MTNDVVERLYAAAVKYNDRGAAVREGLPALLLMAHDEIKQLRELLREVLMDDDSNVDAAVGLTYDLVARIRAALGSA